MKNDQKHNILKKIIFENYLDHIGDEIKPVEKIDFDFIKGTSATIYVEGGESFNIIIE